MPEPVVTAESVGKLYRLGTGSDRATLSEAVARAVGASLRRLGRSQPEHVDPRTEEIWAVRNVSFELEEGEVLGIVGRNGAGKSTLLKLLSQITLPTEGRVTVRGRMSTLIEVGTGFNPELTGRENVYLNGAILGLKRREIMDRYDEIVEFAGIQRFMETPVKRYSSGMYARLAFAVAAHLDPEILLVDEVLSVGDAEFQRKCLAKIRDVAAEGRGVIFVTHDLGAVKKLCSRAILLDAGEVETEGDPEDVVGQYLSQTPQIIDGVSVIPDGMDRFGDGKAKLRSVAIRDLGGNPIESVYIGQPIRITAAYEVFEEIQQGAFELGVYNTSGEQVINVQSIDEDRPPVDVPTGMHEITVELEVPLLPHEFVIGMALHRMSGVSADHVERAHGFRVLNRNADGTDSYPWEHVRGYVRPRSTWSELTGASKAPSLARES